MTDGPFCDHEYPDEFRLKEAEAGDTITCESCDVSWEILTNEFTGDRWLVRTEVTQPSSWREHPAVLGCTGAAAMVTAMFGPILIGAMILPSAASRMDVAVHSGLGYLMGILACGIGVVLFETLSRYTPVPSWMYRFDRWQDIRGVRSR